MTSLVFDQRFSTVAEAKRYHDRFVTGRRRRTHAREVAALNAILSGIEPLKLAMDLPCGTGRFADVLAAHAQRLVLADRSPTVLEYLGTRQKFSSHGLRIDAGAIPFEDGAVELIFSHRFWLHLPDRESRARILAEFRRVSRRFLVMSFYPPSLRRRFRIRLASMFRWGKKTDRVMTERQFVQEAASAGFTVVRRESIRRFPRSAFYHLSTERDGA